MKIAAFLPFAAAASSIDLCTFDGAKASSHEWEVVNDPVMGGQSYSNFTVTKNLGVFEGEVKIVPFLKAAGFCNAETKGTQRFVDVSGMDALSVKARNTGKLTGLQAQIMTTDSGTLFKHGTYTGDFSVPNDGEFHTATITWDKFDCSWRGEKIKCPSLQSQLGKIEQIGVSFGQSPNEPGTFKLEIESVGAVTGSGAPVCEASEYCCPDAKKCLTPTKTSCKKDKNACASGDVCCPLTEICVTPGKDCDYTSTPCTTSEYCCPDAKACLTPTNPGVFCGAASDCKSDEVCCPLTKLCVSAGKSCVAP
jgi:hypothetical protein